MVPPPSAPTGTLQFSRVEALEILDSRGRPTLQVTVTLADGLASGPPPSAHER